MEIELKSLKKAYGTNAAVDNVDFTLKNGIYGLLGANGAGKTTLIRMLCGLLQPTSGETTFNDGLSPKYNQKDSVAGIGYLPQNFCCDPNFTVMDYLMYVSALKGIPLKEATRDIDELLAYLDLSDKRKMPMCKLSGGTRQRVGIAQAFMSKPPLIVLDEPTTGLDPLERIRFRKLLTELSVNRLILFSTHIVSDIEAIAAQIIIMGNGKFLKTGTAEEILLPLDALVWEDAITEQQLREIESMDDTIILNILNHTTGYFTIRYMSQYPLSTTAQRKDPRLEDGYVWYIRNSTGGTY